MEEQKIIELLFARSEPALSELDRSYGRLVQSIMGHILNDEEDIKECVNDTWLAVWNTIPPQRPDSLLNYVCRIAKNKALHRYRDEHRKKRSAVMVALDELSEFLPGDSLDEQYNMRETIRILNAFLAEQTEENRNIFVLRYWVGLRPDEIAIKTGLTKNTIAIRLTRMRKGLKACLREEGIM